MFGAVLLIRVNSFFLSPIGCRRWGIFYLTNFPAIAALLTYSHGAVEGFLCVKSGCLTDFISFAAEYTKSANMEYPLHDGKNPATTKPVHTPTPFWTFDFLCTSAN